MTSDPGSASCPAPLPPWRGGQAKLPLQKPYASLPTPPKSHFITRLPRLRKAHSNDDRMPADGHHGKGCAGLSHCKNFNGSFAASANALAKFLTANFRLFQKVCVQILNGYANVEVGVGVGICEAHHDGAPGRLSQPPPKPLRSLPASSRAF